MNTLKKLWLSAVGALCLVAAPAAMADFDTAASNLSSTVSSNVATLETGVLGALSLFFGIFMLFVLYRWIRRAAR